MAIKYVNSHIQVSKMIQKNFPFKENIKTKKGIDQSKYVMVLDLQQKIICKKKINSLDAIYGYYEPDIELFFATLEQQMGKILWKIKYFYKGNSNFTLSKAEIKVIKDYFEYSFIRSEKTLSDANKQSVLSTIIGNYSPSFLVSLFVNSSIRLYKDYNVNILINNSKKELLLPKNMVYEIKVSKDKYSWIIMPVSPSTAIVLQHKNDFKKYCINNKLTYINISQNDFISLCNDYAYKAESKENNKFIISSFSGKDELERLLSNKSYNGNNII